MTQALDGLMTYPHWRGLLGICSGLMHDPAQKPLECRGNPNSFQGTLMPEKSVWKDVCAKAGQGQTLPHKAWSAQLYRLSGEMSVQAVGGVDPSPQTPHDNRQFPAATIQVSLHCSSPSPISSFLIRKKESLTSPKTLPSCHGACFYYDCWLHTLNFLTTSTSPHTPSSSVSVSSLLKHHVPAAITCMISPKRTFPLDESLIHLLWLESSL